MATNIEITKIKWVCPKTCLEDWNSPKARMAWKFHQTIPQYEMTPLVNLDRLAADWGVEKIYVKDESPRFGLNAFKVLGGSFAVANYIAELMEVSIEDINFDWLCSQEIREKVKNTTFVTATDGNHGRGVAWAANRLGVKCVVYLPKGSAAERLENIKRLGAEAYITDLSYDDAVRKAGEDSEKNNWVLIQDTAWDGYEKIPKWIMQGYMTMGWETVQQLEAKGEKLPTHIVLQAGVGAMSGAITGFFASYFEERKLQKPMFIIVEPDSAGCIFETAVARDGKIHKVTGNMDTMMAGLACGEPCTLGWELIRDYGDFAAEINDEVAAVGMGVLAYPRGKDPVIVSGESGAAPIGFIAEVLCNKKFESIKNALNINAHSRFLCISTEGDTDRENYQKVIGLYKESLRKEEKIYDN